MARLLVAVVVAVLLRGLVGATQEGERESVRINTKEDLIEISASQDTWWLAHGWATLAVTRTTAMSPEELRTFLRAHWLFELEVDGAPVEADRIVLWDLPDPVPSDEAWVIAWEYDLVFTPGTHVLTGTWTITDLPCEYWDSGCDPNTMPVADQLFTILQPYSIKDGLVSAEHSHTLTLVVLP